MTVDNSTYPSLLVGGRRISVEDSLIRSIAYKADSVRLTIRLWDESDVEIGVSSVVGFQAVQPGYLSSIRCRIVPPSTSKLLADISAAYFAASKPEVRLYEFLDPGDRISLLIVTDMGGVLEVVG